MSVLMSAFEQQMKIKARASRTPLFALFEITPTCNLRCHFCYVALDPYKGPYLSTTQMFRVFDILEEAGVLWLTLTGGEIFSRRDFPEIYLYAKRKGFLITLFSNATMVTEKIATLLREHPPMSMEVSIYGADAEHYEGTTGIPGSFARFERGMQLLLDAGVKPAMKTPITKLSEHHIDAMHAWCRARGLPYNFDTSIDYRHGGGEEPVKYRIESKRTSALRATAYEFITGKKMGMPLPACSEGGDGESELYYCSAGRTGMFIDALGQVGHCVMDRDPMFPILEMPFQEIWDRIGTWVTQPLPPEAPCSGCGLRHECKNCPARARLSTGSAYLKDTYHCDSTHALFGLEPADHTEFMATKRQLGACV